MAGKYSYKIEYGRTRGVGGGWLSNWYYNYQISSSISIATDEICFRYHWQHIVVCITAQHRLVPRVYLLWITCWASIRDLLFTSDHLLCTIAEYHGWVSLVEEISGLHGSLIVYYSWVPLLSIIRTRDVWFTLDHLLGTTNGTEACTKGLTFSYIKYAVMQHTKQVCIAAETNRRIKVFEFYI